MKRAFVLISLFVLVACDNGKQIMKPVVTPEQIDETIELPPSITFENVFELEMGQRYRMIPTGAWYTRFTLIEPFFLPHAVPNQESTIWSVLWGSVGEHPPTLLEGFTDRDPKVQARFSMGNADKTPYALTLDGKKVIEEGNEIVIEIVSLPVSRIEEGGTRGNKFDYQFVEYSA
ncbi:hypothetical protein F4X90_19715, partial [Candidatus Poribacteria bacterium]|nr:hypothetical protein [Candidatus Poribacteria bacterium]